jgi:hypothetical protein
MYRFKTKEEFIKDGLWISDYHLPEKGFPEKWNDEIYPVVCAINSTYDPPLDVREVNTIYRSICNKELQRRAEMEKEKSKINSNLYEKFFN